MTQESAMPVPLDDALVAQIESWRDQDLDPATALALTELLTQARAGDQAALSELASAFAGPLSFGTAGLRAALGPGPGRMNRVVVSQAAAGFGRWLHSQGHSSGRVLVGHDARYNSDEFAQDTAEILSAAGFEVWLTDGPVPTPVVAFGIGTFDCVAAVVVTASHNPAQDNGYKVYLGDGSQIIPPADEQIAAQIAEVAAAPVASIPRSTEYRLVGAELIQAYVDRASQLYPEQAPRQISWAYTALHGVGAAVVEQVVDQIGLPPALAVAQQNDPDPAFPTVSFPNPEEPGAIDLAISLAIEQGVDLVVANDPDADRCAVAIPIEDRWRMLTGDELGALLADDALRRQVPGRYACSVVSSTLLATMAAAHGAEFVSTLTGFKWIGRVPDLAFGYEEAIGYCCDPRRVPDKDGITTAVTVLRLAAELKAEGLTLADRLAEIDRRYGVHATGQLSVRVADLTIISTAMSTLRDHPPATLLGEPVQVTDLSWPGPTSALPATDAVELTGDSIHVVVRPSGTEPKLKCYLEVRIDAASSAADLAAARATGTTRLAQLRDQMGAALGL